MVNIQFNDLKIEKLSRSSGVFSGDNLHYRAKSMDKRNEGTGLFSGDRTVHVNNKHVVIDSDLFDVLYPNGKQTDNS